MGIGAKRNIAAIIIGAVTHFASAQFDGTIRRFTSADRRIHESSASAGPESGFQRLASQLFDLRMRLLISAAQSSAWESVYARCMNRALARPPSVVSVEPLAIQTMQRQTHLERDRLFGTELLSAATENLYRSLSPDQQRIADQLLPDLISDFIGATSWTGTFAGQRR